MAENTRRFAFPDGSTESFVGDLGEMIALATAVGIRNSMEDHHAGVCAAPEARVVWPGGSCAYGDAARISPERHRGFALGVHRKVSEDLHLSATPSKWWSPEMHQRFAFSLLCASKWYLPERDSDLTERLADSMRGSLPGNASRKAARSLKTISGGLGQDLSYADGLAPATKGNLGPVRAFERNQEVTVETGQGVKPWSAITHMGDADMKAFNIRMADYVASAHEAMERVAFERPARRGSRAR